MNLRIVRYAIVGAIGIPVHLLALAIAIDLMGDRLYPLALACAFEVSTTINFILNQVFTYSEQKHLRGWDWVTRAFKAQVASLSAQILTYTLVLVLKYALQLNPYVASTIGIGCAFLYNFAVANRFVFRPAPSNGQAPAERESP